jgi:rhamnogalacturonan endolyase
MGRKPIQPYKQIFSVTGVKEIIYPTPDSSELRIFSTTIPTEYRLYTLMHDPVYRTGIAWQNTTYNQLPHIGFYLGKDIRETVLAGKLDPENIDYPVSLGSIRHSLNLEWNGPVPAILTNKLDQVQHHLDSNRATQAAKQLEDFIKHLNKNKQVEDSLKSNLISDARKLIGYLKDEA